MRLKEKRGKAQKKKKYAKQINIYIGVRIPLKRMQLQTFYVTFLDAFLNSNNTTIL